MACSTLIHLANEQETNRMASGNVENRTSSDMDDRTSHELYFWPWYDAVKENIGSIMCVMNRVNGRIGCESDHIQNPVLRLDWASKASSSQMQQRPSTEPETDQRPRLELRLRSRKPYCVNRKRYHLRGDHQGARSPHCCNTAEFQHTTERVP